MSDPDDFSAFKSLAVTIESARVAHDKPLHSFGAYLLGIAVAYLQWGGASDARIRKCLEDTLKDD